MPSSEMILDHIVVKAKRRFQCHRCQRIFVRLEHLQRHERTHTQERPFQCNQCDSRFTRRDLLMRHKRLSHNKGGERPQPRPGTSATAYLSDEEEEEEESLPTQRLSKQSETSISDHGRTHTVSHSNSSAFATSSIDPNSNHVGFRSGDFGYPESPSAALQTAVPEERNLSHALAPAHTGSVPSHHAANGVSQSLAGHFPPASLSTPMDIAGLAFSPLGSEFESLDGFAAFLESGTPSSYHFQSLVNNDAEQPMPFFSLDPYQLHVTAPMEASGPMANTTTVPDSSVTFDVAHGRQDTGREPTSFSRFGSRLPSPGALDGHTSTITPQVPNRDSNAHRINHQRTLSPESSRRQIFDVSTEDRDWILQSIADFFPIVPVDFQLPSRLSLARYMHAYIDGFHEHLPFLHIPTMTVAACAVELLLAMAAVGAQYCFEADKGVELFHAARAIATERIRIGDAAGGADLMQTSQALLILMAMATWARHKEIAREALALQSLLASIVRDDGLDTQLEPQRLQDDEDQEGQHEDPETSWAQWIRHESAIRTKFTVFCFFNLQSIVYDIPPLILNFELKMRLPCSAAEFKADTAARRQEAAMMMTGTAEHASEARRPSQFQDALRELFSDSSTSNSQWHSSLGNYILMHALLQHIFLVRQTARCRFTPLAPGSSDSELTADEAAPLERALRNWQLGWERDPESSLDPSDPSGPVAFNSTALLRLAYIRLSIDTGPSRALGTRDPVQIAKALQTTPAMVRRPRPGADPNHHASTVPVRALLHAAHTLSIPVKIGIRLVAKTQTFIWSIQHSLCSLECALMLSKWLEALSEPGAGAVTDDERRIMAIVTTMLAETEFAVPPHITGTESPDDHDPNPHEKAKHLNVGVLRVWATIFKGAQTWAIVDVIGTALDLYADMLEAKLPRRPSL
ncbi:zinc finger protein ADR1 [Cercophora scortea]|uniref:Zinc finger protein ADR1 n=1 Tax=Cercophora scortea TaxID=314031 RepID=A0AAE0IG34_9PEZI|nr:zinc finger protein ADR1 [Cercophora scortea]